VNPFRWIRNKLAQIRFNRQKHCLHMRTTYLAGAWECCWCGNLYGVEHRVLERATKEHCCVEGLQFVLKDLSRVLERATKEHCCSDREACPRYWEKLHTGEES